MTRIITLLFLAGICSCTSNHPASQTTPDVIGTFPTKQVLVDTSKDDGWGGDVKLSFTEKKYTDTSIIYKVNSLYENKNIGFNVSVPKEGHVKLVFQSLGTSSDRFIRFLNKIYLGKTDTIKKFNQLTLVDCIHMGNYVDSLTQQTKGTYTTTHFCKLFFMGNTEDDYAELYLDINNEEHWIELKEKDIDYRKMIIKFLTSQ